MNKLRLFSDFYMGEFHGDCFNMIAACRGQSGVEITPDENDWSGISANTCKAILIRPNDDDIDLTDMLTSIDAAVNCYGSAIRVTAIFIIPDEIRPYIELVM